MDIDLPSKSKKPTSLGKGLSALLSDGGSDYDDLQPSSIGQMLPVEKLQAGASQPRTNFEEEPLLGLAASIQKSGILQPLLVRSIDGGKYEIIAGERRWRAAKMVGLSEVPVIVRNLSNREGAEFALIENVQREDLSALEEANGYKSLINQFQYTQEQLAARLGKSRTHIANLLRLLHLPEKIQQHMNDGKLSAGHARALIKADDPIAAADYIIKHNLSVRDAEKMLQTAKADKTKTLEQAASLPRKTLLHLQNDIQTAVGLPVKVSGKGQGGNITIKFSNLEDVANLLGKLDYIKTKSQPKIRSL